MEQYIRPLLQFLMSAFIATASYLFIVGLCSICQDDGTTPSQYVSQFHPLIALFVASVSGSILTGYWLQCMSSRYY